MIMLTAGNLKRKAPGVKRCFAAQRTSQSQNAKLAHLFIIDSATYAFTTTAGTTAFIHSLTDAVTGAGFLVRLSPTAAA